MSALPANVVEFKLPKRKPKIVEKGALPDQRNLSIMPLRAITDPKVTDGCLRVLALLCSYTNRAGLTWVSQARLATDLKVSRQAITKKLAKLREAGYVEIKSKGFRGERSNTLRVIFDPNLTAADAIAITSGIEDTRPPEDIRKEAKAMQEPKEEEFTPEQLEANKRRLKALLSGIATTKTGINHQERTMPKETETVRRIKEEIARKKGRVKATPKQPENQPETHPQSDSHRQPNTVANETPSHRQPTEQYTSLHRQPHRQPNEVAPNEKERIYKGYIKVVLKKVECSSMQPEMFELLAECMSEDEASKVLDALEARYASEGLPLPKSLPTLVNDMITLHADALSAHQKGPTSR